MIETAAFTEHLKSLTDSDWNTLFDLQAEIETAEKFGELHLMDKTADGFIQLPFWDLAPVAEQFIKVVYNLELLPAFDWPKWKNGKKMLQNKDQDFNVLNIVTLCKLLTVIIRADRFNDGLLVRYFKNGTIQKIIKALQNKVSNKK